MELAIQKYLKAHGLEKTVEDFSLKCKDYGHKVHLKYDQINSSYAHEEVRDARGLVLEKNTWKVMCLVFRKFFNSGEGYAANINWNNAEVFEKLDGALIQLYYDWVKKEWCVATSGMGEGEGLVNQKEGTSFADLFWKTATKYGINKSELKPFLCYGFELMSPHNIVVKPHTENKLAILGARDIQTLKEIYELEYLVDHVHIPACPSFSFDKLSLDTLKDQFINMPFSEEGYVVRDVRPSGEINRIKIKNPAYVAAHHLKSKLAAHHIMSIVKTNEVDEFIATFPDRKEEILKLQKEFNKLIQKLEEAWEEIKEFKPKNITKEEKKKFAIKVFEITKTKGLDEKVFTGCFFGLENGKIESIQKFMSEYDDKKLYYML